MPSTARSSSAARITIRRGAQSPRTGADVILNGRSVAVPTRLAPGPPIFSETSPRSDPSFLGRPVQRKSLPRFPKAPQGNAAAAPDLRYSLRRGLSRRATTLRRPIAKTAWRSFPSDPLPTLASPWEIKWLCFVIRGVPIPGPSPHNEPPRRPTSPDTSDAARATAIRRGSLSV
jgi:hypothetical protein